MYSQSDEEAVILSLFKDTPTGRLLDIGAYDGRTFSNSLALIEKGWSAVLVEPDPISLGALLKLHASNPLVKIVGALIGTNPGLTEFLTSGGDAVSTSDYKFASLWTGAGVKFSPVWLPTVNPMDLYDGQSYDFVTIDIEDNTVAIVNRLLPILATAKVVCVEHTVGPYCSKDELLKIFCNSLGFSLVHTTGENFIFAK